MESCTVGSVRGAGVGAAMVNLHGHEAGNGGHRQGIPTAHRPLSYSDMKPVRSVTHVSGLDPQEKIEPRAGLEPATCRLRIECF